MSNLGNIAIGLIVAGLLLVRQLQPRPARETSSIRLVLILGAAGIAEISKTIGTHHLTTAAVAWLAVSLMAGAGIGAIRTAAVRIWRAQDGSAWRQAPRHQRRWRRASQCSAHNPATTGQAGPAPRPASPMPAGLSVG